MLLGTFCVFLKKTARDDPLTRPPGLCVDDGWIRCNRRKSSSSSGLMGIQECFFWEILDKSIWQSLIYLRKIVARHTDAMINLPSFLLSLSWGGDGKCVLKQERKSRCFLLMTSHHVIHVLSCRQSLCASDKRTQMCSFSLYRCWGDHPNHPQEMLQSNVLSFVGLFAVWACCS